MILFVMLYAQGPPPPPTMSAVQAYKPTEIQLLRLQVKQRDMMLAQRDYIDAQRRYGATGQALFAEAETVKRENGWPETVTLDADKLEFKAPPEPKGDDGKGIPPTPARQP